MRRKKGREGAGEGRGGRDRVGDERKRKKGEEEE